MSQEQYPQTIPEFISVVLSKIAVLLVLKNGNRHLVTWNKSVLELFGVDYEQKKDLYKFYNNSEFFVAYELTHNRDIKISVEDVAYPHFLGFPFEIAPPLYINPAFEHILPEEKVFEIQSRFLNNVKKYYELGYYKQDVIIDNPDQTYYLINFKEYIQTALKLTLKEHECFEIFQDDDSGDFHFYSNNNNYEKLLKYAPKIALAPIIYTCLERDMSNFANEVSDYLDNKQNFDDTVLKAAWKKYLENTRLQRIQEITKEGGQKHKEIQETILNKIDFLECQKHSVDHGFCPARELTPDNNAKLQELKNEIVELILRKHSDIINSDTFNNELLVKYRQVADIFSPDAAEEKTQRIIEHIEGRVENISTNTLLEVRQYEIAIDTLVNLDFENVLNCFNDNRLFLRYWPEEFGVSAPFHEYIRPFTNSEVQGLLSLIKDNINFDLNQLYKAGPATNYSVLTLLDEECIENVRIKRVEQIKEISKERVSEIRKEIDPIMPEFSEEEAHLFNEMIAEISNIEAYEKELREESVLMDVLSYWPLALYPKPDNIADV